MYKLYANDTIYMRSFPVELYRPIVEASEDLYSLLFVSKAFYQEAARCLYLSLTLPPPSDTDMKKPLHLLRLLADTPRLAIIVRKFTAQLRDKNMESLVLSPETAPLLAQALHGMLNLRVLLLMAPHPMSSHILRGCSFQLQSLSWDLRDPDNDIQRFLSDQTELEHLYVAVDEIDLPPHSLPTLSSLVAKAGCIRSIVPGRRISRIHVFGYLKHHGRMSFFNEDIVSARRIQALTISYSLPSVHLLRFLIRFPNLRYLDCRIASESAEIDLIDALTHLPRLQKVKIRLVEYGYIPSSLLGFAQRIFERSASVDIVGIAVDDPLERDRIYYVVSRETMRLEVGEWQDEGSKWPVDEID